MSWTFGGSCVAMADMAGVRGRLVANASVGGKFSIPMIRWCVACALSIESTTSSAEPRMVMPWQSHLALHHELKLASAIELSPIITSVTTASLAAPSSRKIIEFIG